MHSAKYVLLGTVFACMLFSSSLAQAAVPVQPVRICNDTDLKGVFKLVDLKETPPSQEDAWYHGYPNQFMEFLPGHTYNFVATKRPVMNADELKKALNFQKDQGFHQEKKYTLDDQGELQLYLGENNRDYDYRCLYSAKDTPTSKKGDITLTGYSKTGSLLNKLFRPWH